MTDPATDHLFDPAAPPDPEVARLERLLRPLGAREAEPPRIPRPGRARGALLVLGAFAAAAAAAGLFALVAPQEPATPHAPSSGAEALSVREADDRAEVAAGEWVEAGDGDRELLVGDLGRVRLAAGSRLQVRHVSDELTRLYLARGELEATVSADARPRFFQVDTDAARCVDLGCRYTLSVADDGAATVRVEVGQVAFETPDREVYVPAGAVCTARAGTGPGTPRFADASGRLSAALDAFDAAADELPERRAALAADALRAVRDGRDTLPAWHLLQDRDPGIAAAAAERLELVAGPHGRADLRTPDEVREAWRTHLEASAW